MGSLNYKNFIVLGVACAASVLLTSAALAINNYLERRALRKIQEDRAEETWTDEDEAEEEAPVEINPAPSNPDISEYHEYQAHFRPNITLNPDIFKITGEDFLEDNGNVKLTATYYIMSNRLLGYNDDMDDLDPAEVGMKDLKGYFLGEGGINDSLFMRNETEGIDFEIIPLNELYEEAQSQYVSAASGYVSA